MLKFLGLICANFCGLVLFLCVAFLVVEIRGMRGGLIAAVLCWGVLTASTILGRRISSRDFRRGFRPILMSWSAILTGLSLYAMFAPV